MNKEIFQAKHELWLEALFGSFALQYGTQKDRLYDFSQILFRHLKWIAGELKEKNHEYDYEKKDITIKHNTSHELYRALIDSLSNNTYPQSKTSHRIKEDEKYIISVLSSWLHKKSIPIDAFNMKREYKDKGLTQSQKDALTTFLVAETYKEYELIMVYLYMQNYTQDVNLFTMYQDLVDESHYHLKCFGNMLSAMGILFVPRQIDSHIYKIQDTKQFLLDGIKQEQGAKQECQELASKVGSSELSRFFSFINEQESFHIELMQKALKQM